MVNLETELHEERQTLQTRQHEAADLSRQSAPGLRVEDLGRLTGTRTRSLHRSTSPLKDYRSRHDRGYSGDVGSVRFDSGRGVLKLSWEDEDAGGGGDAGTVLHDLHQSVRDLTSEQRRLGAELAAERDERRTLDVQHRRSLTDLTSSVLRPKAWESSPQPRPSRKDTAQAAPAATENALAKQLKSLTEALKSQQESNTKLSTNISQAVTQMGQPQASGYQQQQPRFTLSNHAGYQSAATVPLMTSSSAAGAAPPPLPYGMSGWQAGAFPVAAHSVPPLPPSQAPAPAATLRSDDADVSLRRQLLEAEAQRRQVQLQLENLQEKYDEAEGNRRSLLSQVEESKQRVQQAEEERFRLKLLVDQYKAESEREQRRSEEELDEKTRALQRLATELGSARDELGRSVPARDAEDSRRELQKAERRQARLSEQLEALSKQLKDKESQCASYQGDLKQLAAAKSASDADRLQTQTRLDSIVSRLRDAEARVDGFSSELAQSESLLQESERKRQDIKDKAHQAVKLWKDKCRLLEEASTKQRDEASKTRHEREVALGERDAAREQLATGARQLDAMGDELARLASARAQQDEQLQRQEAVVAELRSIRADLEHRYQEQQFQLDQAKLELQSVHGQLASLRAEKARLDSSLDDADRQQAVLKDRARELKCEVDELRAENATLSRRLLEEGNQRAALAKRLETSEQTLSASRRDLDLAQSQLMQLQAAHARAADESQQAVASLSARLDAASKEAAEVKARESKLQADGSRKLKQLQLEKDAELQAIKLDLADTQSSLKMSRKQEEARAEELREVTAKLSSSELKAEELGRKCQQLRNAMAEASDEEQKRARWSEEELHAARSAASSRLDQYAAEVRCLHMELKLLVSAAADFSEMRPPAAASSAVSVQLDSEEIAREAQSLVAWLRQFVNEKRDTETRLRSGLRDAAVKEAIETDWHRSTIAQLQRQKRDVELEAQMKESEVRELEDKVVVLNQSLEEQQLPPRPAYRYSSSAGWSGSDSAGLRTSPDLTAETSEAERHRILQQYSSLQSKFSSLKDELSISARGPRRSSPTRGALAPETTDRLASSLPVTSLDGAGARYNSMPDRTLPTRDSSRTSGAQKYVRIQETPLSHGGSRTALDNSEDHSLVYRMAPSSAASRKPSSILKTGSTKNLSSTR